MSCGVTQVEQKWRAKRNPIRVQTRTTCRTQHAHSANRPESMQITVQDRDRGKKRWMVPGPAGVACVTPPKVVMAHASRGSRHRDVGALTSLRNCRCSRRDAQAIASVTQLRTREPCVVRKEGRQAEHAGRCVRLHTDRSHLR